MFARDRIFAAYADDEITVVGTICKFIHQGAEVTIVNTMDGGEGYPAR